MNTKEDNEHNEPDMTLDNSISPIPLLLKNIKPYAEGIKECFGLYHPTLNLYLDLLDDEGNDDQEIFVREYVTNEEIRQILVDSFPEKDENPRIVDFLWLLANLYYGNSIETYREKENETADNQQWEYIENKLLKLYCFMAEHKDAKEVTVTVGDDKLVLGNEFYWIHAILDNRVFPNCIPYVHSKEEAEALLPKKKAGRPESREKETNIVCGLQKFFKSQGYIEGEAPKNLTKFIRKFLVLMDIIKEDDLNITENWIKSQIKNIKQSGKDTRYWTNEAEDVNVHDPSLFQTDPIWWIYPHE